ncbi:MAG: HIT family protein [Bacillota bacterium]
MLSSTCEFCRIVRGETERYVVFEDEVSMAFLDLRPLFPGHLLLVPKQHYETLTVLPDELIASLFANTRLLARAVEEGLAAHGSFVAVNNRVSQSVPHLHIHVVPRRKKDGLRGFFWPRQRYSGREAILAVQETLQATVARLR